MVVIALHHYTYTIAWPHFSRYGGRSGSWIYEIVKFFGKLLFLFFNPFHWTFRTLWMIPNQNFTSKNRVKSSESKWYKVSSNILTDTCSKVKRTTFQITQIPKHKSLSNVQYFRFLGNFFYSPSSRQFSTV